MSNTTGPPGSFVGRPSPGCGSRGASSTAPCSTRTAASIVRTPSAIARSPSGSASRRRFTTQRVRRMPSGTSGRTQNAWHSTEWRTSPLPAKDPVTPELRRLVLERDQTCLAPILDPSVSPTSCLGPLTLDHVQDQYGRMGKRAPSDYFHLATLCWHHHLNGWATAHRPVLRTYLGACRAAVAALVGRGGSVNDLVLRALGREGGVDDTSDGNSSELQQGRDPDLRGGQ